MDESIKEKIERGWIRSRVWFDVLAVSKEAAEESLKHHIEKLKRVEGCVVVKERYEETIEQKNPLPNIEKGFSKAVEVEILTKDLETLLEVTIFFAPSAVEVIEPEEYRIRANTVQAIMNTVADLIHRFAAQGIGGVVIAGR